MDFFAPLKEVTTWITLLAFIVAIVGAIVTRLISKDLLLISKADESDRAKLIERALDKEAIDPGLTREQRFRLLEEKIRYKRVPWIVLTIVAFLIAIIFLVGILSEPTLRGDPISIVPGEVGLVGRKASDGEILILVAGFDGPEPLRYRIGETIFSKLKTTLEEFSDVRVEPLGKIVTVDNGGALLARSEGAKRDASIVVWGWYGATSLAVSISTNFEILKTSSDIPGLCPSAKGAVRRVPLAELQSFTVQTDLSNELAYLSLVAAGMARYIAEDWSEAVLRFTKAIDLMQEEAPSLDPNVVRLFRADAYYRKGNRFAAIAEFSELSHSKFSFAQYSLGKIYWELGNIDDAITELTAVIEDYPEHSFALYYRSLAYRKKGNIEASSADLEHAFELASEELLRQALRDMIYEGKIKRDATDACLQGKRKDPRNIIIRYICGDLYYAMKKHDLAIKEYRAIEAVTPKSPILYSRLGSSYLELGQPDAAILSFRKAIQYGGNEDCIYIELQSAYRKKGQTDEALSVVTKGIRVLPSSARLYRARALLRFFDQDDNEAALRDCEESIHLDPYDASNYQWCGYIYSREGQPDKAIDYLNRAASLSPTDASIYSMRASVFYKRGNLFRALNDYERALSIDPRKEVALAGKKSIWSLGLGLTSFLIVITSFFLWKRQRGRRQPATKSS